MPHAGRYSIPSGPQRLKTRMAIGLAGLLLSQVFYSRSMTQVTRRVFADFVALIFLAHPTGDCGGACVMDPILCGTLALLQSEFHLRDLHASRIKAPLFQPGQAPC